MELKHDDPRVDMEVFNALRDTGIPANILGYQYLKKALPIVVLNPNAVLKAVEKIYLPIADEWDTSYSNIQQGIRRAIRVGWERANLATLEAYFGQTAYNTKMMPKTLEYIAVVAEKIRIRVGLENVKTPIFYEDEIVDDKITRLWNDEKTVESLVTRILHEIGVPAHIKGYQYVRETIILAVKDEDNSNAILKCRYDEVANLFNTTAKKVESAIRHAVEVAWDRGDLNTLQRFFGYTVSNTRGKPTNTEFISILADQIRLWMKENAGELK